LQDRLPHAALATAACHYLGCAAAGIEGVAALRSAGSREGQARPGVDGMQRCGPSKWAEIVLVYSSEKYSDVIIK
jgi:hypothetical protein